MIKKRELVEDKSIRKFDYSVWWCSERFEGQEGDTRQKRSRWVSRKLGNQSLLNGWQWWLIVCWSKEDNAWMRKVSDRMNYCGGWLKVVNNAGGWWGGWIRVLTKDGWQSIMLGGWETMDEGWMDALRWMTSKRIKVDELRHECTASDGWQWVGEWRMVDDSGRMTWRMTRWCGWLAGSTVSWRHRAAGTCVSSAHPQYLEEEDDVRKRKKL